MTIAPVDGWLFGSGYPSDNPKFAESAVAKGSLVALLSHSVPVSAADDCYTWLQIEEQVDGMECGTLRAYILPLPVLEDRLAQLLEATDWDWDYSGDGKSGWRHDLSWHNTPMDSPKDKTVQAYVRAVAELGLVFTPAENLQSQPYGIRLAQAVYPLDPTNENLAQLGISAHISDLFGQPVDRSTHALVLLTPNDD